MEKILKNTTDLLLKKFWLTVSIIFAVKLIMAFYFPITGDEAYFYQWGKHLHTTYYDHSAITGLWVYFGQLFGKHIFFPRAVSIFSQFLIFLIILVLSQRVSNEPEKAQIVSLAFLLSPILLLFFMVTTDSPLFFFAFLAAISYAYGFKYERLPGFLLSGVFLGLGLFSKYLIFFVASGIGFSLFFVKNKKKIPLYILAILIGIAPFILLHTSWAQDNCWWPLQFNIFNRAEGKGLQIGSFVAFIFQQVFLMTPWVLWYCLKQKQQFLTNFKKNNDPFFLMFLLSFVVLAGLSFFDTGLHWGLSIYTLLYLSIWVLSKTSLKNILALSTFFSALIIFVLVIALALVPKFLKGKKHFEDYVIGTHGDVVHQKLLDFYKKVESPVFATIAYTTSGIMEYHSHKPYIVFNSYNYHGRNDDQWTNYKELNGRNFIIISLFEFNNQSKAEYKEYFENVRFDMMTIKEGRFHIAIGENFNYKNYHRIYLTKINKQFYSLKKGLPKGQCFFKEKYF